MITARFRPRVVSLDLDDTLWAMQPLLRAEYRLWRWLRVRHPRLVARHSPHAMRLWRERIADVHPERRHDLAWLRTATLAALLTDCGYPAAAADEAMRVFTAARNDVQPYPDVRPALARLRARHTVVALTNGSADLGPSGLAGYFHHRLNAAQVGAAKPDAAMFAAVCDVTGAAPADVLHVGDHPVNDVVGAAAAGLRTAWINRTARPWPSEHAPADWECGNLHALLEHLDAR